MLLRDLGDDVVGQKTEILRERQREAQTTLLHKVHSGCMGPRSYRKAQDLLDQLGTQIAAVELQEFVDDRLAELQH